MGRRQCRLRHGASAVLHSARADHWRGIASWTHPIVFPQLTVVLCFALVVLFTYWTLARNHFILFGRFPVIFEREPSEYSAFWACDCFEGSFCSGANSAPRSTYGRHSFHASRR